jgi:ornithine racemase
MVDLGDLREGMMPADLPAFVAAVEPLRHVDLVGVNLMCYGAIVPDEDNLGRLAALAADVERLTGRPPRYVSGGNSGSIGMVTCGRMPAAVKTLRIGETILLGVDTGRPSDLEPFPPQEYRLDPIDSASGDPGAE